MARYFHGNTDIQGVDGLQTLVLMNPSYVQYYDTPQPSGNHVFLNSAASSLNQANFFHAPPSHTQQFVGIPVSAPSGSTDGHNSQSLHEHQEISALHSLIPRIPYTMCNPIDHNTAARETPRSQQGLSLSLSSQQPAYGSPQAQNQIQNQAISAGSSSPASGITNGVPGMQSMLLNSKYLKAVQEILEEVVNVGHGLKKHKAQSKPPKESSTVVLGEAVTAGEESGKCKTELSTAERQEIQLKKAKLMGIQDEVEQRYRQYRHQMQIVISSFEQAAGIGSAKTYTALALQTISRQFRCLKDAITGQIRSANRSLCEEDYLGEKSEGSRLKFVDNHIRQQRALEQLGMIRHNAWRPQRGLPERSVSVLRAWLFEHFLHPYPKDADKHMLAKQTGLTRSQVSNWFINARVRLWKPMVEEMYMEELKEQEQNGLDDKMSNEENREDSSSKSIAQQEKSSVIVNQDDATKKEPPSMISNSNFSFMGSSELEGITQCSPKNPRRNMLQSLTTVSSMDNMDVKVGEQEKEQIMIKFGGERQSEDEYSMMGAPTNFIGGFGQYPIGEIGRFSAEQFTPRFSGNGVSLTLGLPPRENLSLSTSLQSFLPNQNIHLGREIDISEPNDFGSINTSNPHSTSAYESIKMQNGKRFASQLLPDFVA